MNQTSSSPSTPTTDALLPSLLRLVSLDHPVEQMLHAITTLEECGNCEFLGVERDCWSKYVISVRFKSTNDLVAFSAVTLMIYAEAARTGNLK